MGTEGSKVQFYTQQQYRRQQQRKRKKQQSIKENSSFFKIQQCHYPHPLMEQIQRDKDKEGNQYGSTRRRCTMKHSGFPGEYNLCSKCEQEPQRIRKSSKIIYEQNTYQQSKPEPISYNYKPTKYKEKQILAPGPQLPAFYNAFSLPLDRYYKQKPQFHDYIQPEKGSPFRDQSKSFVQSVQEQVSNPYNRVRPQREIQFDGRMQNLKLH